MNVREPIDYTALFEALNETMSASLPQMELYYEIGRLINSCPEKGAAVAAAEYLSAAYPDISGFSPRNVRRMRAFYHAYESSPEVLAEAMTIGWTQNVVILEAKLTLQEKAWYIRAARQFGWSKLELHRRIAANAYLEVTLDFDDEICYTEENTVAEEAPSCAAAQDSKCDGNGDSGSTDGVPAVLCLFYPAVFRRRIHPPAVTGS